MNTCGSTEFLISIKCIKKFQYLIVKEHDTSNFQGMVILDVVESPFWIYPFPPLFPLHSYSPWYFGYILVCEKVEQGQDNLMQNQLFKLHQRCKLFKWAQSDELVLSFQHMHIILFSYVKVCVKTKLEGVQD